MKRKSDVSRCLAHRPSAFVSVITRAFVSVGAGVNVPAALFAFIFRWTRYFCSLAVRRRSPFLISSRASFLPLGPFRLHHDPFRLTDQPMNHHHYLHQPASLQGRTISRLCMKRQHRMMTAVQLRPIPNCHHYADFWSRLEERDFTSTYRTYSALYSVCA